MDINDYKALSCNANTAAALVSDFVTYGVLSELTGGRRNRQFYFTEYIAIFGQREEAP